LHFVVASYIWFLAPHTVTMLIQILLSVTDLVYHFVHHSSKQCDIVLWWNLFCYENLTSANC